MSLEERVLKYQQIQSQIRQLEDEKQKVYKEILQAFPESEKEIFSENYLLKRYSRLTIKTSLEEARAFQATKIEEIVDKDKLKALVHSGIFVPNITEANYFFIHNRKAEQP